MLIGSGALLALSAAPVQAQTATNTVNTVVSSSQKNSPAQSQTSNGNGKNNPSIGNRPIEVPRIHDPHSDDPNVNGNNGKGSGKPDHPPRSDKNTLPGSVQNLIVNFQTAREAYLTRQKELRLQLKTATDEQREAIRQQIADLLEEWKEQHREFIQETKDRAKEMKNELNPDLGRVVDGAKGEGRGR